MKKSVKNLISSMLKVMALTFLVIAPNLTHAESNTPSPETTVLLNKLIKTDVWTEYQTFAGIKIEYRFQNCDSEGIGSFRNQTLVFFKFTNTTKHKLELSWQTEVYRDNACVNCAKIDNGEHSFSVKLDSKQVIEGDCSSFGDQELYIHANFIKLVPGMTEQYLTDFKFINLQTAVWE